MVMKLLRSLFPLLFRRHAYRAALLLTFLSLTSAWADSVSVTAVADAFIEQNAPDANAVAPFPGFISGGVGVFGQFDVRRGLFRFDLSSIPAGATINSAVLRLTVVKSPANGPANSIFEVRKILQNWGEFDVTWNSRLPGTSWESAGASGAGDVDGLASSSTLVLLNGTYDFNSTSELVADVLGWVNNPASNFGWLLISENEFTPRTARLFGDHESGTGPLLLVDYTPAVVSTISITTQPQGQSVVEGSTVTFKVVAGGTPPFTYQWFFKGNPLTNQISDTLTLTNAQTGQSGNYTVTVSNSAGSITSQPATLNVQEIGAPIVTIVSPTNGATFPENANVLLVAEASQSNSAITQVEFLLGTNRIGVASTPPF